MAKMFDSTYIDPFNIDQSPSGLVNFATGMVATSEVEGSLLTCLDKGKAATSKFVTELLVPKDGQEQPLKSIHDPMPRSKLLTMSTMRRPVKVGAKSVSQQ